MSEYKLTDTAKEDLDFKCSECGTERYPKVVNREESPNPLADYRITVSCVECGNETQSDVWERDVTEEQEQ